MKNNNQFKQILQALRNSFDGIKYMTEERAFRQEVILAFFVIVFAVILPIPLCMRMYLIFSIFFIICMEIINTAIETIINRISLEIHPISKKAKDIGSALVLFSFLHFFTVILLIVLHYKNISCL